MGIMRLLLYVLHYILSLRTFLFEWSFKCMTHLGFKEGKQTPCQLRSDSKNLKKLPIHIGFVIVEEEFSYKDLANLLVWSMTMGITYISLYDRIGILKRNESILQSSVDKQQQILLGNDRKKYELNFHTSNSKKRQDRGCNGRLQVDVILLSLEDGRRNLVDKARSLSKAVSNQQYKLSDITPSNLDAILQDEHGCPDPDLILKFGRTESLLGYQPWQIRLTEILSLPTHHSMDYKIFYEALQAYGDTDKRFGK